MQTILCILANKFHHHYSLHTQAMSYLSWPLPNVSHFKIYLDIPPPNYRLSPSLSRCSIWISNPNYLMFHVLRYIYKTYSVLKLSQSYAHRISLIILRSHNINGSTLKSLCLFVSFSLSSPPSLSNIYYRRLPYSKTMYI